MKDLMFSYRDYTNLLKKAIDVSNTLDTYNLIEEKKVSNNINNICYTKEDTFGFFKLNINIIPYYAYKGSNYLSNILKLENETIDKIINYKLCFNLKNNTLEEITFNNDCSLLYGADIIKYFLEKNNQIDKICDLIHNSILVYPETTGALIYLKNNTFFKSAINKLYFDIFTVNKQLLNNTISFNEKIKLSHSLQSLCDNLFIFYEKNNISINDKRYLVDMLKKEFTNNLKIYNNRNNLGCNIVLPYKYQFGEEMLNILINEDNNNYIFNDCAFVSNYFLDNGIDTTIFKEEIDAIIKNDYKFDNDKLVKIISNESDLFSNTFDFLNTITLLTNLHLKKRKE